MPLTSLTPSPDGLAFIKRYQGLSLEKYQDDDGLWLIGYGHLIRDHDMFDAPLTLAQVEDLFQQDVDYYHRVLCACVRMPLTQHQYDALLSLAFSLGPEGVQQSPIVSCINRGEFSAALHTWKGEAELRSSLAVQRQAESALFDTAVW